MGTRLSDYLQVGLIALIVVLSANHGEAQGLVAGFLWTEPPCLKPDEPAAVLGDFWEILTGEESGMCKCDVPPRQYDFLFDGNKVDQQGPNLESTEQPFGGFRVPASTRPGRHNVTVNLVRRSEVILTKTIQVFVMGEGAVGVTERIRGLGRCGKDTVGPLSPAWGSFGESTTLEANSGERLRLACAPGDVPLFALLYTSREGRDHVVGQCPFKGGCNDAWFMHAGDNNPQDGKPDCILATRWNSRDYGDNDVPNPATDEATETPAVLDHFITKFDAATAKTETFVAKWEYAYPPPVLCPPDPDRPMPERVLLSYRSLDPPLGPENDAFFEAVRRRLQALGPTDSPMEENPIEPCDLNADGQCDVADFHTFRSALGSCVGQSRYRVGADFDADNCVTFLDYQMWHNLVTSRPSSEEAQSR